MLNLWGKQIRNDCAGIGRRDFLKVGTLGMTGLTLPACCASGPAASTGQPRERHLGHLALARRRADARRDLRSEDGRARRVPQHGRRRRHGRSRRAARRPLPEMGRMANKMAFVRSFAHGNSGHAGGTHFVMTGVDHPPADAGEPPIRPSMGSIAARVRGPNHPQSACRPTCASPACMPTARTGSAPPTRPFDVGGQAQNNINLRSTWTASTTAGACSRRFDTVNRQIDRSGVMAGLDAFDQQAVNLLLGRAKDAFDLAREDPRTRDRYTTGTAGSGRATCSWPAGCAKRAAASSR